MSQLSLRERLGVEPTRAQVVADCVALVDAQVKRKSGFTGAAIKAAYATVKRIKRGFVSEVIAQLLDEWLDKIQPYYDAWLATGSGSIADHLSSQSEAVADDLLSVTDSRADNTKHKTVRKAYQKMRGSAKKNVAEAIPDLGKLLERHLETTK